jgi:hypothetical protein
VIEQPKKRNIKSVLKRSMIVLYIFVAGFFAGKIFQHSAHGYHFKVRQEENYDFALGEIRWRYATESFGMPFMDTGTTLIEFGDRTLYKAKRYFQESVPFARNIQTSGSAIYWDDGECRFNLTVEKIVGKAETSDPK